jgi:uncharacterized protein
MDLLHGLVAEFGGPTLIGVAVAAVITSCVHGTVGVAGGFLMSAALAQLVGVRPVVPVMSIALLISHGARSLLNLGGLDWKACAAIMTPAVPLVALGAYLYSALPVGIVALVLGLVISASIPLRHWARARRIRAGVPALVGAGAAYGFFAGASIGSAMLLGPFVLGYGLVKEGFVATMAMIQLGTNLTRIVVFGGTDLLSANYVLLGVLVGALMIPGNWIGRTILRRIAASTHGLLVDGFALVGALNFFYLAAENWP